jgi:Leucine-rich repeat (LRR) protein
LTNLRWIELRENQISDFQPLTGLKRLEKLDLQNNKITNKVCPFKDICEF